MTRGKKHWVMAAVLATALTVPASSQADEGLIAGIDIGVAAPVGKFKDRVDLGGAASPFIGYMINNNFGLMGQLQFAGFPNDDRKGIRDADSTLAIGGVAGPRLAVPFTLGGVGIEPYGTFGAGAFTGLNSHTPISRTSWGYSTGGGLNFRLTDALLLGGFARYNNLDQRVEGDNVEYVTAGLGLTYNQAAPEPVAPVVAEAPPPPAPAPPKKKKIVLRGVNFDYDKAVIRADAKPILDEAASTLKEEGTINISAQGHTDSRGSDKYNQNLSERRAQAVKDYLVKAGVPANRIDVVGKGESAPVATNDTDGGRAENRRVELLIL